MDGLRARAARMAPSTRMKRRICPDRFHSRDQPDEELHGHLDSPLILGADVVATGYRCPTCGFQTIRALTGLSAARFRIAESFKDRRCRRDGHPEWLVQGVPLGCRCGERRPA